MAADVHARIWSMSGPGSSDADYAGKNVQGKIVLAAAQTERSRSAGRDEIRRRRHRLLGAEPEQPRGGEDRDLVRWGHLDTFAE